jgi:glucose/arabinose dehydrogenase
MRPDPSPLLRRSRPLASLAGAGAVALLLSGCGAVDDAGDDGDDDGDGAAQAESAPEPVDQNGAGGAAQDPGDLPEPGEPEVVATGLDAPWSITFLPGGDALVSERDSGRIRRVGADGSIDDAGEVPGVNSRGEGGLLGIAVSPDFADDGLLYAYFTSAEDNRIVRMPYDEEANSLGDVEPLVPDIPISGVHNGGRIVFGPDGNLYAGTGDASETGLAQDPDSLGGKVLRMTPDGEAPGDNPFPDSVVFTLGHRNVQGLDFDDDGRLWASEFGQDRVDEVNLLEAGENYGWPEFEGAGGEPEFRDPVVEWDPAEASPSGAAVAEGSFWVASLRGERLWQVPLTGDGAVGTPRDFFDGEYGRLRTVVEAPDGSLWLLTNNTDGRGRPDSEDDRILRVPLSR